MIDIKITFHAFLNNMTLIIAFMFLVLQLKEYLVLRYKNILKYMWVTPIFVSLLSIAVMWEPLIYGEVRLDLRGVPIFYISYLLGWKYGLISTILPALYRYQLGGTLVMDGIFQAIILPFIIGAFFQDKKSYNPPYSIINMKHMLSAFFCYQILRLFFILQTTHVSFMTVILLIVFELVAVLCIFLMQNSVSRKQLLRKELEYHSRHDSMTDLYNIRFFRTNVEKLMQNNVPIVIAMMDVDYFKKYNDIHGHPAGDAVLRTIAQLLNDTMRQEDIFARYGGEEFIMCFTKITNMQTAANIAERVRKNVEDYRFFGEETQPNGKVTVSVGIGGLSAGKSLDELIKESDQMLYKAKKLGRNVVACSSS
ncbi:GGDEF domain-containing protein [Niallia circulans]|uniref:GGDEF domain-containing protein n=1 Tax=Niallia circulans TaxID=1397 RepID=UPI001F415827|nr:GGDEF domain-containing protein [Niallia circulans]MCM2983582.1 diguanylate cyclase [Niallia circulans]